VSLERRAIVRRHRVSRPFNAIYIFHAIGFVLEAFNTSDD
jgi:uncharacterized membrane protein YoaT (DUF817 family)